VLDVLFVGFTASPVTWTSFKEDRDKLLHFLEEKIFLTDFFFYSWSKKDSMNPGPVADLVSGWKKSRSRMNIPDLICEKLL
jgi:hypothetical protein